MIGICIGNLKGEDYNNRQQPALLAELVISEDRLE